MTKALIYLALLVCFTQAAIRADIVHKVPGYSDSFQSDVYAGYLNTSSPDRRIHYVFVEHQKGANNTEPITLWLNGGPGCSSLLGFLQEIGPFYLEEGADYKVGDQLVQNPYSWHKISNLLFIESPAGVGYSTNKNSSFEYSDLSTMNDNFDALQYFFTYYPEFKKNKFWIAGESYAGKYIPDLAFRIDHFNLSPTTKEEQKINLKGVFIGNGVIDFRNDELQKSQVEYAINRDFIDPQIMQYWLNSCQVDEESAGCQFFYQRYSENIQEINPYNVYSYCYYNGSAQLQGQKQFLSQETILMTLANKINDKASMKKGFNGAPCAYFNGMYQYFNAHAQDFHAETGMKWNGPCAEDISAKYKADISGSTHQLSYLFTRKEDIHMILYNGDWDGVVPYVDTLKNLEKMGVRESYLYTPIFLDDQHIGFSQVYSTLNFILVKGASHQVPQSQRAAALHLFEIALDSHESSLKDQ